MDSLKEMCQYLHSDTRLDLKAIALQHVLSVTGTADGRELLLNLPDMIKQLIILMQDKSPVIAKDAALAVINITADESGTNACLIISESSQLSKDEKQTHNLIQVCYG